MADDGKDNARGKRESEAGERERGVKGMAHKHPYLAIRKVRGNVHARSPHSNMTFCALYIDDGVKWRAVEDNQNVTCKRCILVARGRGYAIERDGSPSRLP